MPTYAPKVSMLIMDPLGSLEGAALVTHWKVTAQHDPLFRFESKVHVVRVRCINDKRAEHTNASTAAADSSW